MFWIVISSQPKSQSQTKSKSHCHTDTFEIILKIEPFFVFKTLTEVVQGVLWVCCLSVKFSLVFGVFYLLRCPQKFSFYDFFILSKFIWMKILFTIKIRKSKTLIRTRPWFFKVIKLSEFKFFKNFERLNFCIFLFTRIDER